MLMFRVSEMQSLLALLATFQRWHCYMAQVSRPFNYRIYRMYYIISHLDSFASRCVYYISAGYIIGFEIRVFAQPSPASEDDHL